MMEQRTHSGGAMQIEAAGQSEQNTSPIYIEETECYAYWLNRINGLGTVRLDALAKVANPKTLWELPDEEWRGLPVGLPEELLNRILDSRHKQSPQEEYAKLKESGILYVSRYHPSYPAGLRGLHDRPFGLFYIGKLPDPAKRAVAVIGARNCSEYGRFLAQETGRVLAGSGCMVISGMAKGIDGISQKEALLSGGYSAGVLGCGPDICYPPENRELYRMLAENGCLLSEYLPGTLPKPGLFPLRNRIIAALCDALVVIEARERSGTLITVDQALEQGKDVYVYPGRVTDSLSRGCNRLIAQGAGILQSPEEIPMYLGCEGEPLGSRKTEDTAMLTGSRGTECPDDHGDSALEEETTLEHSLTPEALVESVLDHTPASCEAILKRLEQRGDLVDCRDLTRILTRLTIQGKIGEKGGGYFICGKTF